MKSHPTTLLVAALFCASPLLAQERSARPARSPAARGVRETQPGPKTGGVYSTDVVVVRDAQEQALDQVRSLQERVEDAQAQAALENAVKEMERSLAMLEEAKQSPEKLATALAAEQSAYQALLKLAAREYQVSRSRSQQGGGGQQGERSERQLDELELKQSDNRYETQRQASPQQNAEQREQLQVLNRLKELAQRQQDLNERLKELQASLQEAKTEEEREEIRRRLKRLREEEREMLADVDELRQRMERPENQSRMADAREQLDKTRSDVQRAAEALEENSASQALSSGTRAQRQLQQLTDDFRKKSSNRFADEMRQMRNDARELAQKQEDLAKKLEALTDPKHKTLSDSEERKELASQITQQKGGLTNLFTEMRRVSEQAENAEPLLSKQLYDTLRQTDQSDPDKALDLSAELVNRGFLSQAGPFEQRARKNIDELKRGVEKAAESVLGDDVEALRLARRELETLSQQLEREIAQSDTNRVATNLLAAAGGWMRERYGRYSPTPTPSPGAESRDPQAGADSQENSAQQPGQATGEKEQASSQQPGSRGKPGQNGNPNGQSQEANAEGNNPGQQQSASAQEQNGSSGSQGQGGNSGGQRASRDNTRQNGQRSAPSLASGSPNNQGGQGGGPGGNVRQNFFDGGARNRGYGGGGGYEGGAYWPLTGDDFVDWSDRLRDVEEMVDLPDVRNEVARIRDRARVMRMDFKREGKKPDWAVVRLQISGPLVEVRDRVAEELARRESNDALVPIDRDPVPPQFSELVRRYYEQLGKSE
jgi:hypothetical protein